jgi:DNA-binding NtrC family response regulator
MIKRVVILQDEQLVIREIERNMQRALAAVAPVAVAVGAGAVPGGMPAGYAMPPIAYPPPASAAPPSDLDGGDDDAAGGDDAAEAGNGSLASVAKAASMKAERAAIETTLRQVHWNRRKAAQILGVSYKTLLNKIKECGISRA